MQVGVVLDHVRKLGKHFTPYAKSLMDEDDATALQSILDNYDPSQHDTTDKAGTIAAALVPIDKKNKADKIAAALVPIGNTDKADKIAAALVPVDNTDKADKIAIAFAEDVAKHKRKKRRLQPHSSSVSSPSSAKPTPPSGRSSMLFAALLTDTVITHICLVFLNNYIIRYIFGKYISKLFPKIFLKRN